MKIALLMDWASPWSQTIALKLRRMGHEVEVIDFQRTNSPDLSRTTEPRLQELLRLEARFHKLPPIRFKSLAALSGGAALRRLLGALRPDILLCLYSGVFGTTAYLSGFKPYAVFAMGSDILLLKSVLTRFMTARVFKNAAYVCANGRYLAERGERLSPGVKVEPLLHGVQPDEFPPASEAPAVSFLCNRSFRPVYNNAYIIEALRGVSVEGDFRFRFAGDGPLLDETRALADRVLPPETRRRVEFVGRTDSQGIKKLLKTSRFYVSMSRSDGTATSLLEALSSGLYPILSDIPQNREWIDGQRRNGMLVPLDQPPALTAFLNEALASPELWANNVQFNRSLVLERADMNRNLQILVARLEAAVERSRAIASRN